jgi:hypothetical protein
MASSKPLGQTAWLRHSHRPDARTLQQAQPARPIHQRKRASQRGPVKKQWQEQQGVSHGEAMDAGGSDAGCLRVGLGYVMEMSSNAWENSRLTASPVRWLRGRGIAWLEPTPTARPTLGSLGCSKPCHTTPPTTNVQHCETHATLSETRGPCRRASNNTTSGTPLHTAHARRAKVPP